MVEILAYAWYGGWWWWWLVVIAFIWLIFLPPFSWGSRWYGGYRGSGIGTGPASAGDPAAYQSRWESVESRFEAAPDSAVVEADGLVGQLLRVNGNPPDAAERYRDAHAVTLKAERHQATSDELSRAMMTFRWLFQRLTPVT